MRIQVRSSDVIDMGDSPDLPARANEGTYGKIQKHCGDDDVNPEMAVLRPYDPGAPCLPGALGKKRREKCKEDTRDFVREGVRCVAERFPKSPAELPCSANCAARRISCRRARVASVYRRGLSGRCSRAGLRIPRQVGKGLPRVGDCGFMDLRSRRLDGRSFSRGWPGRGSVAGTFTQNLSRNARSDAQFAANIFASHNKKSLAAGLPRCSPAESEVW